MAKKKKPATRKKPSRAPEKSAAPQVTKSFGTGGGLRYALNQGQPGGWASDHREEAAHFTSWNYVAINAVAKQAAQADVAVYRDGNSQKAKMIRKYRRAVKAYGQDSDTSDTLPPDSPLMRLQSRPNPTQSGSAFRYEQVMQLLLTGTCLIWKVPNQAGLICERYVIPTAVTSPVMPSRELPRGGWRVDPSVARCQSHFYGGDAQGFTELGGFYQCIGKIVPAENMQVIRNPHPIWKDDGYSAVAAGAKIIDSAAMVDQSRFSSLHNSSNPSLVIRVPAEYDPTPDEMDAIAEKFNAKYAGTDNDGKAMFVKGDGEIIKLNTNPKEMDFVQAFIQLRDAVMALHGVPGIAAGITDGGSYAAFYASLKQFTTLTVQPTLDLLSEEDTEQIAPQFGEGLTVELTAAAIDDPEVLERQLQTDLQAGIRTKGEMRAMRGLPPFGDERDNEIAGETAGAGYSSRPATLHGFSSETTAGPADERSTGKPQAFPSIDEIVDGVSKRLASIQKLNGPHEFSCTMINIADCSYTRTQGPATDAILRLALEIPDDDLTEGRELEPHVTVKYGTHTDSAEELRAVVEGFGTVRFRLGKTSIFAGEKQDVVKIDVSSPDLVRLNKLIASSLANTTTHPIYHPHITLAYVKSGLGEQYAGRDDLEGFELSSDVVVFSDQSNSKTKIKLTREQKKNGNVHLPKSIASRLMNPSQRGALAGFRDFESEGE